MLKSRKKKEREDKVRRKSKESQESKDEIWSIRTSTVTERE